jgi:hypothetical protein
LVLSCATVQGPVWQQLDAEAPRCDAFASFDHRVRVEGDALVAQAPAEQLVLGSSALSRARRACAKHVLSGLMELREQQGVAAMQRELDALAQAFSPAELDALITSTLGPDAATLRPLLAEAAQHAKRSPGFPQESLTCRSDDDCEATACLAEAQHAMAEVEQRARRCLAALRPEAEVRGLARLMEALRPYPSSGVMTEVRLRLETLRRRQWPQVEAALSAGHPAAAARLALPFAAVPEAQVEVGRVRDAAVALHLAHAREAGARAFAVRLHRRVAASLGGPDEPPLTPEPGHWASPKWGCSWNVPALPPAVPAAELRLMGACTPTAVASGGAALPPSMQTFDLERSMRREQVSATLVVTCAGRSVTSSFVLRDVLADSALGHDELVRAQLDRLVAQAGKTCRGYAKEEAARLCSELTELSAVELEQRFASAYMVTGEWEPCFAGWFERTWGVPPP